MFNPFAQGGWTSPESKASYHHEMSAVPPSIFGALPYPDPTPHPIFNTLYFVSSTSILLNMKVIGPGSRLHYHVATDETMPNYTVLKDCEDKKIALVEWRSHPCVEVRGFLPKQSVRDWLRLSEDKKSRSMEVKGVRYTWIPQEKFICLFTTGNEYPELLARVAKNQRTVNLEITPQAMKLGLQEPIVVATLLLQSGRTID